MTLTKLPSEIIDLFLAPQTLRTLINCSGLHSEFNKGLDQRFQQIGRRLHEAAVIPPGILSSELLCVISRVIFAAFSDWGQLAGASPLQSAAQAELNRRLAFPHPWFTITPDGTVQELQSAVKFGAWQAGHAYVEAHDNNSNSLHGCHSLEIRICMSPYPLQLIAIEICREVGMKPCIITFHLTLLEGDIKGFTAFCGAIAYLFFATKSHLPPIPRLLSESELVVRLKPQHQGIVKLADMSSDAREGLAYLMLMLRRVVSRASFAHATNDHECPLAMVLNEGG
jgi:hypothetical protein